MLCVDDPVGIAVIVGRADDVVPPEEGGGNGADELHALANSMLSRAAATAIIARAPVRTYFKRRFSIRDRAGSDLSRP
jgi:hypothetical protein